MDLYIAEKPSLAKTLAEHLAKGGKTESKKGYIIGDGWVMTWCLGHLYELADPSEYSSEWDGPWRLEALPIIPKAFKYRPVERTKDQLKIVHDLCAKSARIISAADADREGCALLDLVIQHSPFKGPVFRLWPIDLSTKGLDKAFSTIKPNSEYRPLSVSALCRSQADWLVGINFTRLYTCLAQNKGYQGTLSLGRVQTVAFSIVHNRCIEIEEFKPLPHYALEIEFTAEIGKYLAQWVIPSELTNEDGYLIDRAKSEAVKQSVQSSQGLIKDVHIEDKAQSAPLPFSLSQLQTYCSKKWGYAAKQVLNTCQYLYEDLKAFTYPRTDCSYLSEGDFNDAANICTTIIDANNLSSDNLNLDIRSKPRCYNDKKTTAHTAIIPTSCPPNFDRYKNLSPKDQKNKGIGSIEVLENIYMAVSSRFLAQFMPKHQFQSTTIITVCKGYEFKSKGKVIVLNGWKELLDDKDDSDDTENQLPHVRKGESVVVSGSKVLDKRTKAPEYFTEGTLIAAMANISKYIEDEEIRQKLRETDGIGTEATRADIIERLKKIGYLRVDGKKLIITSMGREIFPSIPPYFKTAAMTAIWERALQRIAEKKIDHNAFEKNIGSWTETQIRMLLDNPPDLALAIDDKYKCKECNAPVIRRSGKFGPYWPCTNRDCKTSYKDFKMAPLYPLEGDGNACPECKKAGRDGLMKTRTSKENREKGSPAKIFLGCNKFPECKHAEWKE